MHGDGAVSPYQALPEPGPTAQKGLASMWLHKAGMWLSKNLSLRGKQAFYLQFPFWEQKSFQRLVKFLQHLLFLTVTAASCPHPLPQLSLVFVVGIPIFSAGSCCLSPHQISKGPTFTCVLLATVVAPAVHFSTTRLNFGTCFIYRAGMTPAQQTLVITNKANKDMR